MATANVRLDQEWVENGTQALANDAWLTEQVDLAFEKLNSGETSFIDHDSMGRRIAE